ncbi:MAG: hypothetical protein ACI8XV_001883 [Arenicella sp.]|jgi:hypothetical protein
MLSGVLRYSGAVTAKEKKSPIDSFVRHVQSLLYKH